MQLTVVAPMGFADVDAVGGLSAWRELAGISVAQALRDEAARPSPGQMLDCARRAGVEFDSLHAMFGHGLDPSSPDERVRQTSVEVFRSEAEVARQIGARDIVVHPACELAKDTAEGGMAIPAPRPSPGGGGREADTAEGDCATRHRQLLKSINELSEIADELDVRFLLENLPPGRPIGKRLDELAELVRASRGRGIGLCFDTGHAHLCGNGTRGIAQAGDLLGCVHASDNDGTDDQHRLCFEGAIDWPAVNCALAGIGYEGPFMLEVFLSGDEVRRRATPEWLARLRATISLG